MTECTEQKNMFVLDCISENANKYEIVESNYLRNFLPREVCRKMQSKLAFFLKMIESMLLTSKSPQVSSRIQAKNDRIFDKTIVAIIQKLTLANP